MYLILYNHRIKITLLAPTLNTTCAMKHRCIFRNFRHTVAYFTEYITRNQE